MRRSSFQVVGMIGIVAIILLLLAHPAGAIPGALQIEPVTRTPPPELPSPTASPTSTETPTPTITPSPIPEPYITVTPNRAFADQALNLTVNGYNWRTDGPGVTLTWDVFDADHWLVGPVPVQANGTFVVAVQVRRAWATVGTHKIIAWDNVDRFAEAEVILEQPTPSTTPSPSRTSTPTTTPTPSPTLRPVTPVVTISPIAPTPRPPGPVRTNTPVPTRTNTPVPGTATLTATPSITPTPSQTPGPGTPSVTPQPTNTVSASATPVEEISDTGSGSGLVMLWGFVLAGLVAVFRLLRVRSLPGQ